MNQDVAYGLRMLVDIAIGALSSGPFEDPTTAVQSIDRIHDVLRHIVHRPLHSGEFSDDQGSLRLTMPLLQWHGFVLIAFEEIREAGSESPQVARRLKFALEDLIAVAPPDRRACLEHQLTLLTNHVTSSASHRRNQQFPLASDPSGIGSAIDLVTSKSDEQDHSPGTDT
ncbi:MULTISPECIES: DUF2254 family protein [unclassified Arthrobacter]|uniref:DUF2254 family protein n=1 Tax=unclassified Arthrobacter TaxID=235627 RepID=UPI00149091C6|nr:MULTISPECIES: DUF2254 family protein [unclassified Arthrobacter]NOJ64114.1 DUF2254 domain-containing protein [Arthrobacter sp. 147(2020)]